MKTKTGKRIVVVKMTRAEAKWLAIAAGNTLDHEDAARAVLPNGSQRRAAYRGYDKLWRSLWTRSKVETG